MKKFRAILQLIFFIPVQLLVFCIVLLFTGFLIKLIQGSVWFPFADQKWWQLFIENGIAWYLGIFASAKVSPKLVSIRAFMIIWGLFTGFAVLLSIPSILGDSFTLIETVATSAAYIIAFWFCYKKSSDGNPIREALNEREI